MKRNIRTGRRVEMRDGGMEDPNNYCPIITLGKLLTILRRHYSNARGGGESRP
jgi:hypothetical protein